MHNCLCTLSSHLVTASTSFIVGSCIFAYAPSRPFFLLCPLPSLQGYASGDCDKDAFAIRHFVAEGLTPAVTQSFSKNMGLYGERVGALSIVCQDKEEKERVMSQVGLNKANTFKSRAGQK